MRVDVAPVFWIGVNALHKFGGLRFATKHIGGDPSLVLVTKQLG
jgi:hypothetical protein